MFELELFKVRRCSDSPALCAGCFGNPVTQLQSLAHDCRVDNGLFLQSANQLSWSNGFVHQLMQAGAHKLIERSAAPIEVNLWNLTLQNDRIQRELFADTYITTY